MPVKPRGGHVPLYAGGHKNLSDTKYMFTVYFLESLPYPDRHYIGYSEDLKNRLSEHNAGRVTATKKFRPWKVIYAELYPNKLDALGREKFLKSGSGWKYLKKQLSHYFNK